MLDTVILRIYKSKYRILNRMRFYQVSSTLNEGGSLTVCRTYANNGTKAEKRAGVYRPCLTLVDQIGKEEHLNIQFSTQIILFGHCLTEVRETDFEKVLDTLRKSIYEMEVLIDKETLRSAEVVAFHPAKNILITSGHSSTEIAREFSKVNITEKMAVDHKDFQNGGHGVQFWSESHALTFYDKNKDLEKSEKTSYGNDQKIQQAILFDYMKKKQKPDVLRMEVRLCKKPKMNSVLRKLGLVSNPTFADIFKERVCRAVLLDYWETFIEPSYFIFTFDDSPLGMLESVLQKNKRMKIGEAIKLVAYKILCKSEGGTRRFRQNVESRGGLRKWQYISPKLKFLNRRIPLKSCYGYIKEIKQALQKFKPYKPEIG